MNLHDELGRHGADAAAESAGRLESAQVRATLGDRVRRGRRRRALGGAGAGAVVALAIVGLLALVPLGNDDPKLSEPAAVVSAGPYEFEVAPGSREADPEVMLRGDTAVMCGDTLDLTPGVTVHDAEALESAIELSAELTTLRETMDTTLPATPVPLDLDLPEGLTTEWDPNTAQWDVALGGDVRSLEVVPLLMDGETVTGVAFGISAGGSSGPISSSSGVPIPRTGQCDQSLDSISNDPGDPMDSVLVAQYWGAPTAAGGDAPLLATIVVDPTQPATAGAGLPGAELVGPDGGWG
ncbi:hypothetical protein [Demequina aurantiaca]|uniref:hypothetical protein n=1 Tax=Demequina aurantiaca TaxID=676200 RepID=UPI003D354387